MAWLMMKAGPVLYMVIAVVGVGIASVIAELHERNSQTHDAGEIVIDEVIGYVIAATWLPVTWQTFVAAFVAFRVFDIWKPFPIRQIDQKAKGGLGTVLDDVAAGIAANMVLQLIYGHTGWLGETLRG